MAHGAASPGRPRYRSFSEPISIHVQNGPVFTARCARLARVRSLPTVRGQSGQTQSHPSGRHGRVSACTLVALHVDYTRHGFTVMSCMVVCTRQAKTKRELETREDTEGARWFHCSSGHWRRPQEFDGDRLTCRACLLSQRERHAAPAARQTQQLQQTRYFASRDAAQAFVDNLADDESVMYLVRTSDESELDGRVRIYYQCHCHETAPKLQVRNSMTR